MSFDRTLLPDPTSYFESQGLKLNGRRSAPWKTTSCHFHGGSDSMRIIIASGGWICMSCGEKGGDVLAYEMAVSDADFVTAAKAIGAWVDDGKPLKVYKPAPLTPRQALSVLSFEATLVAIAACNVANGHILTEDDKQRLLTAGNRLITLAESYK